MVEIRVLAEGLDFPEGPAFDPAGDLWCVELHGGNLVRWSEQGVRRYPTGGRPNGLWFDSSGMAWFCDSGQNAIRTFDPRTRTFNTTLPAINGVTLGGPNDLIDAGTGNLIFTCPNHAENDPVGYVCCVTPIGSARRIAEGMYFPNGLAMVQQHDRKRLVVAETHCQRLWIGDWDDEQIAWIDPQPWLDVGGSTGPDGMVYDGRGLLYVAIFGGGQIKVIDVNASAVFDAIDLPGANPTNCTLDPTGRLGLIVTEAETGRLLSVRPARGIEGDDG
jgi:gluconolactonase